MRAAGADSGTGLLLLRISSGGRIAVAVERGNGVRLLVIRRCCGGWRCIGAVGGDDGVAAARAPRPANGSDKCVDHEECGNHGEAAEDAAICVERWATETDRRY